jgi:tRNA U34 2-thiouridine synthase MnmA/TrmU
MISAKEDKIVGLGLISGGLDSLVASLLIKLQNIEVIGLNFRSPFCLCDKAYRNAECGLNLYNEKLAIKVYYLQKEDDYLEIVRNPKFGYGKNMNPCIDCRIYILKKAKKFAKKINADFIFTGEVLNQRPKSQNLKALEIVEEESGLKGELVRPLSAKLLKPTIHEERGLIDRSKLLGIKGRSRKIQLEYARKHNLLNEYYACGGCLLTDISFSNRLRDLFKYNKNPKMDDILILKYGRHFRYKNSKIIVGRNEIENNIILNEKKSYDLIMEAKDTVGPITIIQGDIDEDIIQFAAKLTLNYSDLKDSSGKVVYQYNNSHKKNELMVDKDNIEILKTYIL